MKTQTPVDETSARQYTTHKCKHTHTHTEIRSFTRVSYKTKKFVEKGGGVRDWGYFSKQCRLEAIGRLL